MDEIINAKPTDGLWHDGRTDEDQLGLSYKELEEAINNPNSSNREKYEKIRKMNLQKWNQFQYVRFPTNQLDSQI